VVADQVRLPDGGIRARRLHRRIGAFLLLLANILALLGEFPHACLVSVDTTPSAYGINEFRFLGGAVKRR
jgi:hypothetical protein